MDSNIPDPAVVHPVDRVRAFESLAASTRYIHPFVQNSDELMSEMLKDALWNPMASRSVASFGVVYAGLKSYATSGASFRSPPLPECLLRLCHEIKQRFGFEPNNCLLNYYENDRSKIGFHSDSIAEIAVETGIAILSLGAERELSFRHARDFTVSGGKVLQNGSLFYMTREMQRDWQHAILPSKTEVGARMSLTFRLLHDHFGLHTT